MGDEKQATPHDVLIARVLDVRRAKSEEEWAAAREIERLREQLAKPLSVAPDDEALIWSLCDAYDNAKSSDIGAGITKADGDAIRAAKEALRRRIAELRGELATERDLCSERTRLWVDAKAALAACRDKTIEECAEVAAQYSVSDSDTPSEIRESIRALKDKDHKHG